MARILCIGDSITWGAYDLEMGGWVSRLRHALDAEDVDDLENARAVYNLGIGGDKVSDALARFDVEVEARNRYGIDAIILALGTNDSPHDTNPQGTPIGEFEKQFRELVAKAQTAVSQIVVVGPANVNDDHPATYDWSNDGIRPYAEVVEKVARENDLPFVNLFGVIDKEYFQLDGIHPNADGHKKMYQKIKAVLDASQ
jgi:lysophospholipase L1-like esterase